jgi:aspartyl-tRNA(Asn)/glutamyl-tRNA(Gln) amidotransferase subunit C
MRSVMPIKARWRQDAVTDGDRPGDVLANAPSAHDGYFVVPKVVE